jgi:hypothetical protein
MTWLGLIIIILFSAVVITLAVAYANDSTFEQEIIRELVHPLKSEPQSGFWVNCVIHGDVPLTNKEYNKQITEEKCYCPFCEYIKYNVLFSTNE